MAALSADGPLPAAEVVGWRRGLFARRPPLPLADRATVEPIWRFCAARAENLGFLSPTPAPVLSTDPDLHIQTETGEIIRPLRHSQGQYFFMIRPRDTGLRLISRTFRPSETIGPFLDDRRTLGVLVGAITLHQARRKTPITTHLTDETLPGWFTPEPTPHRWTNGHATLPINPSAKAAILELHTASAGPYRIGVANPPCETNKKLPPSRRVRCLN